jgi:tetratricopeptide (TPR) repeat protein
MNVLLFAATIAFGLTPAELAIQSAQTELAAHRDYFAGYNHLATAYARRARETGDDSFLDRADEAVKKSQALAPGNYDARKAAVLVMLERHAWKAALELAKMLNKQTPDDVAVYGYMADAQIALGDFQGAVENAQWMLNLRPGNAAGLIRAGRLRELYRDWSGAIQVLQMAYDATPFAEPEERAWILVRMARIEWESSDAKSAKATTDEALELFPRYHLALALISEMSAGNGG